MISLSAMLPLSVCGLVTANLDAGGRRLGRCELEPSHLAIIREQGFAAAKCDRLDHEDEFIDQLGS